MESDKINKMVALMMVIGMAVLVLYLPVYPCTYVDGDKNAGYGYHSLMDIMMNGMEWETTELPNRISKYTGDGPYMVEPAAWIMLLYVPIFAGISLFGIEASKKDIRTWISSMA